MKKLFFAAVLSLMFNQSHASSVTCKGMKAELLPQSQLYQFVNNLADWHVYYGTIQGKKTGKIFKAYLTQTCTQNKQTGYVVRFQTMAKVNAQSTAKLFYCYSRVLVQANGSWLNKGTVCDQSRIQNVPAIEFPYNGAADPYSNYNRSSQDIIDGVQDEFPQPNRRGLDQANDPFYDSYNERNNEGPDSRYSQDF